MADLGKFSQAWHIEVILFSSFKKKNFCETQTKYIQKDKKMYNSLIKNEKLIRPFYENSFKKKLHYADDMIR